MTEGTGISANYPGDTSLEPRQEISSILDEEQVDDSPESVKTLGQGTGGTSYLTPDEDIQEGNIMSNFVTSIVTDTSKLPPELKEKAIWNNAVFFVSAEMLFNVLPLIVLAIVLIYLKSFPSIITSPEWSITAAILFGQSLVKISSGLLEKNIPTNWQRVNFILSLIIVLLLAPSMLVLSFVYISEKPSLILGLSQLFLFLLGSVLYVYIGINIEKLRTSKYAE